MGKGKKKRGTYYKRIVVFMLVFMACVVTPFTAILFRASEKKVLELINESNEHVLNQMKYNFNYISDNIKALSLSIFSQNDVSEIMYSGDPQYDDIYSAIKNLEDTVIQAQSSLQSITIYNASTKAWYSTDADNNETNEIKSFLKKNGDVPKLKPILRRISVGTEQNEAYSYIFSYFMYAYSNPSTEKGSFIMVNQTADEFVDNLNTGIGEVDGTYIVSQSGEIYGGREENLVYEKIVRQCVEDHAGEVPEGFYVKKEEGQRYLVSYIRLDETNNTIVMIQNYKDIFKGMTDLRNEFIFLCIAYAVIAAAAIAVMTKRIYTPVDELVSYVTEVSGEKCGEGNEENIDEIGHIRKVFQKASALNKELSDEKNNSKRIVENYWHKSLLTESSPEKIEAFYQNMPESILSIKRDYALAVVCMHLDSYEESRFSFVEEDRQLLLNSAGNVLQEMLDPDFRSEAVQDLNDDLVLILNGESERWTISDIEKHIFAMQEFMKEHFDVTISASYDGISSRLTDLAELYENAKKYGSYKIIYGKGSVLGQKECKNNIENEETSYPRELRKKLDEQLKLGNKEQVYQVLNEIQESISKLSYHNIVINTMSLATKINLLLNEINMMKNRPDVIHFDKIYYDVLNMEFLEELFNELKLYIDAVLTETYQHTEKENDKEKLFLDMVVEFVQENYADNNLSSQSISDYIHMSNRYVMKKFKKCAGITLNEYILTVRMKHAAYLLSSTDMSVGQVSENIGIENENYFYRLFKKVYGCTPREFAVMQKNCDENKKAERLEKNI